MVYKVPDHVAHVTVNELPQQNNSDIKATKSAFQKVIECCCQCFFKARDKDIACHETKRILNEENTSRRTIDRGSNDSPSPLARRHISHETYIQLVTSGVSPIIAERYVED